MFTSGGDYHKAEFTDYRLTANPETCSDFDVWWLDT